jgi:hypothetical protein
MPVAGRREDAGMQQGDVAYVSLFVPDLGRARAFFGSVLGWAFGPGEPRAGRTGGGRPIPLAQPYGWTSDCVADQGTRFCLGKL